MTDENKIRLSLILAICFAIVLVIILLYKCDSENNSVVATTDDSTQYWKNEAGRATASLKMVQDNFGNEEKKWKDSIAKVYKTKTKFIKEVVTVTQKGEVQIINTTTPVIKYVDSNNCPTVLYQGFENPYYIVEAQIDVNGDSSFVRVETSDTLTVLWKEAKEGGLFNKKTFIQLDVSNANPYNKVLGLQAYRVPQKVSRWNKWIKPTLTAIAVGVVTNRLTKK